jgi:hypothetical protein
MNVDRAVMLFAGFVVLASISLSLAVHPWWLALTAFAGLNLVQASFTGFRPAAIVFRRMGLKPGNAFK